jgi:LPS sulfotransferase NodH
VPSQEPTFDFTFIDNLYNLILEREAGWQTFFEASGVQPFKVVYEELVEAYEETVLGILDYLNILYGAKILSTRRNRGGRLPEIIVDDTS